MNIVDIILDKRYGRELSDEQIAYFIRSVTDRSIPDYQISALLMAIVLNGMNERELTTMTMEMANSGKQNDLSYIEGIPVDKHSTGGVGDKITPIILPLCATFGVQSAKLSGRGLGFTGGTVDKFESIAGFDVQISPDRFPELIAKTGMCISGQTPELAPADKILYALRDVTGTVDSIPLIASSIMSKKIAGGAGAIVLDVTCGSGAFMKDVESARKLAQTMIRIGKLSGRETVAVITNMDQPLGRTCGNVLEMMEVYETLIGKGAADVIDVASEIGSHMIELAHKEDGLSHEQLKQECIKRINDGTVLSKYFELLLSQGALIKDTGAPVYRDYPFEEMRVTSPESGYVSAIRTDIIGNASVRLGAGRVTKEDEIDYGAGICFYAKVGDYVNRGDVICSLCRGQNATLDEDVLYEVMDMVHSAYSYSDAPVSEPCAVIDVLV